jgi:hypothetical protein
MDVTVASYTLKVEMNEEGPGLSEEEAKEIFAAEFQRALDDGYFVSIRYDSLTFDVTERTVLRIEDEDGRIISTGVRSPDTLDSSSTEET